MIDQSDQKFLDLAYFHFKAGRFEAAEKCCLVVWERNPGNFESVYLLAKVFSARQDYNAAALLLQEIIEPSGLAPLYDEYYTLRKNAGKSEAALDFFQHLTEVNPTNAFAWHYLGRLHFDGGQLPEAEDAFSRAVILEPTHAESYFKLAEICEQDGSLLAAESYLREAVRISPRCFPYWNHLAGVLKGMGRADEAVYCYHQALAAAPAESGLHSNHLINLLCTTEHSAAAIFEEHLKWERLCARSCSGAIVSCSNDPDPTRKLKIGYVSSDLYCHPVAFFFEPVLTTHDLGGFDVFIYANVEKEDYITAQFKERPCTWRDIVSLSDEAVCSLIREDGIDILIDLTGHTKRNRLLVFARKPAPIQATWLGYANTTGLSTIDYRITDEVADPPGLTEKYHSEELWRLPGTFLCYRPPINPPEIGPKPLDVNGFVTFVAFNNFAKTNKPLFSLWSRILHEVPESRLLMKAVGVRHPAMRAFIINAFATLGIAENRIELLDWQPTVHDHLSRFSMGDIALDCYPYNGTTTTCEALWMGVPVVTLAGSSHVSRVSASILNDIGLKELVATTGDEYVAVAVALARDRERLATYRGGLRKMMVKSSLMDVAGFTKKLENAYREMWKRWCSSR